MAEREEELKSLSKVKEEIEKIGLKLNMPKTKIMVSNPILHGKLLLSFASLTMTQTGGIIPMFWIWEPRLREVTCSKS